MNYFFSMVALLLMITAGGFSYSRYTDLQSERGELYTKNMELESLRKEQKELLDHFGDLCRSPQAIERAVRENLHWCKENEKVYHFEVIPDWY